MSKHRVKINSLDQIVSVHTDSQEDARIVVSLAFGVNLEDVSIYQPKQKPDKKGLRFAP